MYMTFSLPSYHTATIFCVLNMGGEMSIIAHIMCACHIHFNNLMYGFAVGP